MTDSFDPYYKWLGIPPADQPPHYYRLLAIKAFEKDLDVIANAADRQMAHLRTFQSGKYTDFSQHLLNEVSTARLCLLAADSKAAYDEQLRASLKLKQTRPKPDSSPRPPEPLHALPSAQPLAIPMDFELEMPSFASPRRGSGAVESLKKPHSAAAGARRAKKSTPVMLYVGLGSVAGAALVIGLVLFMKSGRDETVTKKAISKPATSSHDPAPFDVTKFDKSAKLPASAVADTVEPKQPSLPAADELDDGHSVTIDNGDTNFSATNNWQVYTDSIYFKNDVTFINGVDAASSDVAAWSFTDLAPGSYLVANYVVKAENRATNVTIKIYDGAAEIASVTQDQHRPTIEQVWEKLGEVTIAGPTLVVKIFGNANGHVMADAVRITPLESAAE